MTTDTPLPLSIIFTVVALCIVLLLVWLVMKFLASIYKNRITGGEIQMRSNYALGARQHLYVVQFRDNDYFLGVTPERIELLDCCPAQTQENEGSAPRP